MLKYIKSIFAPEAPLFSVTVTKTVEQVPGGTLTDPEEFGVSRDGIAHIRRMKNGKFRLLVNVNEVIGTYARLRDAKRGAERKGLTVVS